MRNNYTIISEDGMVEMAKPNSTILVYKIAYEKLQQKKSAISLPNTFIVYVLVGRNNLDGRDFVYVGKSKNGLLHRPTAHEKKCAFWTDCYVLTQFSERSFFNDGTIQYIEDRLSSLLQDSTAFTNTTEVTTTGTANKQDELYCEEYLREALLMLEILGFDVRAKGHRQPVTEKDASEGQDAGPGSFFMKKNTKYSTRPVDAHMSLLDGKYVVLAGSIVADGNSEYLLESVKQKRLDSPIVDGELLVDVAFSSPSSAAMFALGTSADGWVEWKDKDRLPLQQYRNSLREN